MIQTKVLTSPYCHLWLQAEANILLTYVSVNRISFHPGQQARLLLSELIRPNETINLLTINDNTLLFKHVDRGRPDVFSNGQEIISFSGCHLRRQWIPKISSTEIHAVSVWVEIEATQMQWMI